MAISEELAFLDATAQAELVRKKQVKPIELVDAAIERIERLNTELNAVVFPMYDLARKAAEGDLPDGPFKGVPFLLKDLCATVDGVRQTSGSAFTKDFVPDHDSELSSRPPSRISSALARTRGTPTTPPAAPAGARPRAWPRAWCRSRMPTTAAARFAYPPRAAGCSASSPHARATRWVPTSAT